MREPFKKDEGTRYETKNGKRCARDKDGRHHARNRQRPHHTTPVRLLLSPQFRAGQILHDPIAVEDPQLNPAEGVWRWLKRVALANVCCDDLEDVRYELSLAFAKLRRRVHVLYGCLKRVGYL